MFGFRSFAEKMQLTEGKTRGSSVGAGERQ
jgi:hypothetical protein